jgi:peptidoglycan/LPS O-acetylase OafA/YrhL
MSVSRRMYGLDILRSFAILTVVYSHGIFILGTQVNFKLYNFFGFDGVTLFFVLSGFLIGQILLHTIEKTKFELKDLFQFWIRRWFRTLPNYFFVLTLVLVSLWYLNIPRPPFSILSQYFVFFQNFHTPHPNFLPEVWSLAVEEWFYLITPFLFFISFRFLKFERKKIILFWIFSIILLVNIFKIYRVHVYNIQDVATWGIIIKKQVLTRLDSLIIGVFGAYLFSYQKHLWEKYKNPLFYIGITFVLYPQIHELLFVQDMIFRNYFALLSTSLGTLFLLPKLTSIEFGHGIIYNFFTFISKISYSMYLLHFTFVQWILVPLIIKKLNGFYPLDANLTVRYSLYWLLTIFLAFLLYTYFEKPMMNLREKISLKK